MLFYFHFRNTQKKLHSLTTCFALFICCLIPGCQLYSSVVAHSSKIGSAHLDQCSMHGLPFGGQVNFSLWVSIY